MGSNTRRTMTFDTFRRSHLRKLRDRFGYPETGFDETAPPAEAFVNDGAWLVHCPDDDCHGVEYAWEEGFFFCTSCKNSHLGHKYRRLEFPTDRARIEELLIVRPRDNRNWTPKETVVDLERENEEHAAELLTAAKGA